MTSKQVVGAVLLTILVGCTRSVAGNGSATSSPTASVAAESLRCEISFQPLDGDQGLRIASPAEPMRFRLREVGRAFVLGTTSTIFSDSHDRHYSRFAYPGSRIGDECATFSVEGSGIPLQVFRRQLEGFAPFGSDSCGVKLPPFKATWVPAGFRTSIARGSAPLAPGEDGHYYPGGVFHVRGSAPGRQIEIYRAESAWWPTRDRELISILGRQGWLGRSVNTHNVDFLEDPYTSSCDYYSVVGLGLSREEMKRFAEGLQRRA